MRETITFRAIIFPITCTPHRILVPLTRNPMITRYLLPHPMPPYAKIVDGVGEKTSSLRDFV